MFKFYILFFSILFYINCTMVKINGEYTKYCFSKNLAEGDKINLKFSISSTNKEKIDVTLTNLNDNITIYNAKSVKLGNYKSKNPEINGYYELCFYPNQVKSKFYVTFEYYTSFEQNLIKNLAEDKEVQSMSKTILDVKQSLNKLKNSNSISHDNIFRQNKSILKSIRKLKRITYLKIVCIILVSVFQVYVLHKFLGPDKRISKVKGAFQDGL